VDEARRKAGSLMRRALPALARVRGAAAPKAALAGIAEFVYRREN